MIYAVTMVAPAGFAASIMLYVSVSLFRKYIVVNALQPKKISVETIPILNFTLSKLIVTIEEHDLNIACTVVTATVLKLLTSNAFNLVQ